jgi:hypothetical protein
MSWRGRSALDQNLRTQYGARTLRLGMFSKCEVFRVARTNPLRTAVAAIKASGRAVPQSRAISPPSRATGPSTYAMRKRLRRRVTLEDLL